MAIAASGSTCFSVNAALLFIIQVVLWLDSIQLFSDMVIALLHTAAVLLELTGRDCWELLPLVNRNLTSTFYHKHSYTHCSQNPHDKTSKGFSQRMICLSQYLTSHLRFKSPFSFSFMLTGWTFPLINGWAPCDQPTPSSASSNGVFCSRADLVLKLLLLHGRRVTHGVQQTTIHSKTPKLYFIINVWFTCFFDFISINIFLKNQH